MILTISTEEDFPLDIYPALLDIEYLVDIDLLEDSPPTSISLRFKGEYEHILEAIGSVVQFLVHQDLLQFQVSITHARTL